MDQRSAQFSRDGLNNFLDFAGEKGLLKKSTASARKAAANIVLGILDEDEASDLSKVDLQAVIMRHRNLAPGKITPQTLTTYESRTKIAVSDFLEYMKNPSSWKGSQQRNRNSAKGAPLEKAKASSPASASESSGKHERASLQPSVHVDLQIHISPDASPEQIDQIFSSMRRHLYTDAE
jgi:hypothetical protein